MTLSGCGDDTLLVDPLNLCECGSDQVCVGERCVAIGNTTLLSGDGASLSSPDAAPICETATTQIDELRASASKQTDFIELSGPAGATLTGWRLRAFNLSGQRVLDLGLSGALGDDGRWLGSFGALDVQENLRLGNGAFSAPVGSVQLIDCAGAVIDALGYGEFGADGVFLGEGTPAPGLGEGESLIRCPGVADSDDNAQDFQSSAAPSPGVANVCP